MKKIFKDYSDNFDYAEVEMFKNTACLYYLPFVIIYFIIMGRNKESDYLFFHSNQALIFNVLFIVVIFFCKFIKFMFGKYNSYTFYLPGFINILIYSYILF